MSTVVDVLGCDVLTSLLLAQLFWSRSREADPKWMAFFKRLAKRGRAVIYFLFSYIIDFHGLRGLGWDTWHGSRRIGKEEDEDDSQLSFLFPTPHLFLSILFYSWVFHFDISYMDGVWLVEF
jgi:succinate dehydrogenase/fumarate reductase cytochrome b subunit